MTTEKEFEAIEEEVREETRHLSELYRIVKETPEYKAIQEQKERVKKANSKLNRLMQKPQLN